MDRGQIVNTIVYECTAIDGFLVDLRNLEFNEQGFENLLQALKQFSEIIKHEKLMERSIASSIYFLDISISGMKKHATGEFEKRLQDASEKFAPIIMEIFTPDELRYSSPSE